jgi:hypothetical protein
VPRRVPLALALLAVLGLLVAGCGGTGNGSTGTVYTAGATAPCLKQKGYRNVTTDPLAVGLIAGTAEHGGLRAVTADRNVLTIAFAKDAATASDTEQAFTRHAPRALRPHMPDIMESKGNAVLVWTVTPKQQQLDAALGCLGP